jgi:hypothetical protein
MTYHKGKGCPADGRRNPSHQHTASWNMAGDPPTLRNGQIRKSLLTDRCNSELLWASVARAIMQDRKPRLDGKPFTRWSKQDAWSYLMTRSARWRRDITPPEETR